MRVCFVTYDYPSAQSGGGVGRQTQLLAQALVQAGHAASVITLGNSPMTTPRDDAGVLVYSVTPGNLHWYVYRLPKVGALLTLAVRELEYARAAFRLLLALHSQQPFDLIEGTETGSYGLSRLDAKLPLLIRLHGEQYTYMKHTPGWPLTRGVRLARRVQRTAIRSARLLVSPSQAHATEIANELTPTTLPITVISNFVEIKPRSVPEPESRLTVLYVGRLELLKGIPDLLRAAQQVLQQLPTVRFVLAGLAHPSLPAEELTALIAQLGIGESVECLGQVERARLEALYQTAALCALPSYYESFGLVALEAMTFGVPVVATRAGGLPEVVEDGVTGLLVEPGDVTGLSQTLVTLLPDYEKRKAMGQQGRLRAERLFSKEQVAPLNLEIYSQLAGAKP